MLLIKKKKTKTSTAAVSVISSAQRAPEIHYFL